MHELYKNPLLELAEAVDYLSKFDVDLLGQLQVLLDVTKSINERLITLREHVDEIELHSQQGLVVLRDRINELELRIEQLESIHKKPNIPEIRQEVRIS